MIKLFDIENHTVKETVHCRTISWLDIFHETNPDNYLDIYAYLFYMTCPSEEENPFFNVPEEDKEQQILDSLKSIIPLEDLNLIIAKENLIKLYDTVTVRAYRAISTMLDNLSSYMKDTKISAGRDGNLTALLRVAKDFNDIRQSFKGVQKDLEEEQNSTYGGQDLAYDQR